VATDGRPSVGRSFAGGLAIGLGGIVKLAPLALAAPLGLAAIRLRSAAATLGGPVLVEELLEGEELSVFALCDGSRAVPLAAARDYKRAGDGDTGPNTGGMGSFSPVPGFGAPEIEELVERIHAPVVEQLARGLEGYDKIARHLVSADAAAAIAAEVETS